jgi:hypothetical protein
VYGFSAFEMNHIVAGQLDLGFSLLLPLMAYLVVAWRDGSIGAPTFVVLLALALAAQFYLFLETFAFATGLGALALLACWTLAGPATRPVVARLARLAGLAWLGSVVLAAPLLAAALASVPASFHRLRGGTSIDLAGLVVPRSGQTFGLSWLSAAGRLHEASFDGYVGIPLLALAVAFSVLCWSRRLTRFLAVMLAVVVVGALGPALYVDRRMVTTLPWASLFQLPIVRGAFTARLMVFAFLILAVMVALWLASPTGRWQTRVARWALAALAIAAVAADVPTLSINSSGTPAFIASGQYRTYLVPGSTVLVASAGGNLGLRWQSDTDFYFRLAGGFINSTFNGLTDLPAGVAHLADHPVTPASVSSFRHYLTSAKIRAILVDADAAPQWSWKLRKAGLQPLHGGRPIGGVIIYPAGP